MSIEQALKQLRNGGFVIVFDGEDRENEGDLILAGQFATPESIAFMTRHTSGVICVAMLAQRLDELHIPPMVLQNGEVHRTAFTVSVDAREGITTGISARDRARTIQLLANPTTRADQLVRPGHLFPLQYREGGVLKRAGHTEAAVDLMRLAGLEPAGVIAELVSEDGTMMRLPDLHQFAQIHEIPFISIADLVQYRRQREQLVERVATAQLPTAFGTFTMHAYRSSLDGIEHLALCRGTIGQEPVLVRVHSECLTGDVFGSRRCDCGSQLELALEAIGQAEQGVLVYLRGQEGRGIGLTHKLRAYSLQEQGYDTVEANRCLGLPVDSREYGIGAQILADLGISRMRLMTNNPGKYTGLAGYGLEIVERVPLYTPPTAENRAYLRTKVQKLGHLFPLAEVSLHG
jgi:3,4-dihydroxy 2-butanone 4-phosphate synthase/GTP cyclohydrolase II